VAGDDDGDREDDEHNVCSDIASSHCDELNEALPALTTRVWENLPVMAEWVALGEIADDNANKCNEEGPSDYDEDHLMRALPCGAGETLQEFENRVLEDPQSVFRDWMLAPARTGRRGERQ
jgi:hypothetical protein